MNEVKQSVLATVGIVSCAGAVLIGASTRKHNDLGGPPELYPTSRLLASSAQPQVPASDYFYELSEKLKKEYVEPVTDDMKLASGAVRGMITSLNDPQSQFMSKDEFAAYQQARQGKFQGIGVTLALQVDATAPGKGRMRPSDSESNEASAEEALTLGYKIPRVVVADVTPGGPADKAGVKPGDFVYAVDDHWVAKSAEVEAFRQTQQAFLAKKLSIEKYNAAYKALRKKMDRALMPSKVGEKLIVGQSGTVKVEWERGAAHRTTEIERGLVLGPTFEANGDVVRLPFTPGAADKLKAAIAGKRALTLDLRHNVLGDFNTMRECLALVAPSGKYGTLGTQRKEKPLLLAVEKGNPQPPQLTLLVDKTTSGAAEIFALALSSKSLAKLSGSLMGGDRTVRQVVQLPDGAGYTLVTSTYKPEVEQNSVVAQRWPR